MLYNEKIAACSEIQKQEINILCGQKVKFRNGKPGGTYINNQALHGEKGFIQF
jgi:hypothetical protein